MNYSFLLKKAHVTRRSSSAIHLDHPLHKSVLSPKLSMSLRIHNVYLDLTPWIPNRFNKSINVRRNMNNVKS